MIAAVGRGAELYARLLGNDPDADVRMHAAHVLGVLAGPGPAFAPAGRPRNWPFFVRPRAEGR